MKLKKITQCVILTVLAAAQSAVAQVDDEHARSIVQQAEMASYYAGNDGRSLARMIITDGNGQQQIRQFTILRQDVEDRGDQNLMVFFSRPSDVRDTVFRVLKHTTQDDDRWLYLPGLDLVKRISAGDKRTSFVGSHFFYEDVSGRNTEEDYFELLEENDEFYTIKAVPKNLSSVEFTHYIVNIEKSSMLPRKIEFYDAKDRLYRRVESLKIENIDGHPTVLHSRVEDLLNGGATEMQFRFVEYDLGLPETLFSERSLRTPPRRWLKIKG
ncbi:outer membrane lipoprotein-sorting protein [Sessilibacter corallicola]|uniref:Outer membrane lipoprotein-sorting protein n=1 Tax=Sessilibacter corallicola TaxID=2904075 RepID=A0ABQ0AET5_9GAMM